MKLKRLEVAGFKSFAKSSVLIFDEPISAIVGPNGSGKSNIVESFRFVLGEQSNKSMRSKSTTDLLFKGSDALKPVKQASVTLVFDNSDRVFQLHNEDNSALDLAYDELAITRRITDAGSDYVINGVSVRLKDVQALIASVNIGASGHHVISQGEADRVLSATPRQRREMIEDALGLKVYQLRIKEAEKKLEKTEANMREVEIQRRELAPHLRHLEREMKKVEEAKALREELTNEYQHYLSHESAAIKKRHLALSERRKELADTIERLKGERKAARQIVEEATAHELRQQVKKVESEGVTLAAREQKNERHLGQLEGRRSSVTSMIATLRQESDSHDNESDVISRKVVQRLTDEVADTVNELENEPSLAKLHAGMGDLRRIVDEFWSHQDGEQPQHHLRNVSALVQLEKDSEAVETEIEAALATASALKKERADYEHRLSELRQNLSTAEREREVSERALITLQSDLRQHESALEFLLQEVVMLERRQERLSAEIEEGKVLVGHVVMRFSEQAPEGEALPDGALEEMHRSLERKKLRLEGMGAGGGSEISSAYEEASERDQFLAGELEDMARAVQQLSELLEELRSQLRSSFMTGVESMSRMFMDFFAAMFGGGRARLVLEEVQTGEDDEETVREAGILIQVQLPNKKVTEIEMLSGGERSLTSIALLFALSQVNPPPFLVLDETDAALDEANSRRYGDMLERLAKVAQLVVVTHNRETMSRAQNLYGITMKDGASKVLSIKLADALAAAK